STRNFNVTVVCGIAPPPVADITVQGSGVPCAAIVNFDVTATDNCPGVVVTSSPASGSSFVEGTTVVTVTATDASGNTSTRNFNVTVVCGNAPPPVVDITVQGCGVPCAAIVNFDVTATDNCPGVVVTSWPASGSSFDEGTTVVTVTATDASGNTSTRNFNVRVVCDIVAP
ncbi:MAG: hypothetical protein ACI8QF_004796, partial [Limisphaerales bacterium]